MTPHAQMSTGFPYGSFFKTSGDRYPGVPANPNHACCSPCTSIASPKSVLFCGRCRHAGINHKILIFNYLPIWQQLPSVY